MELLEVDFRALNERNQQLLAGVQHKQSEIDRIKTRSFQLLTSFFQVALEFCLNLPTQVRPHRRFPDNGKRSTRRKLGGLLHHQSAYETDNV